MESRVVYILVGIPGSKKSTWARKKARQNPNIIIINQDTFREMFRGVYIYDRMTEPLVHDASRATLILALKRGHDIIMDETNLTRNKRQELVELIKSVETPFNVGITFVEFEPHENCLKRRLQDCRGVSASVWERVHKDMMDSFEPVAPDEGCTFRLSERGAGLSLDYTNLGFSNDWKEQPEIVASCRSAEHKLIHLNIGNCLNETHCPICRYTYKSDSSG